MLRLLFIIYGLLFLVYTEGIGTQPPYKISQKKKPVIGVLLPLSERYQSYGEAFKEGIELIPSLRIVYYDTKGEPVEAVLGAKELILKNKVIAILGPLFSVTATPVACMADFYKTPLITPTTAADVTLISPYVHRIHWSDEAEGLAIGKYGNYILGLTKFSIISPDDAHSQNIVNAFKTEVESNNGKILLYEKYSEGETNFKEIMLKIKKTPQEGLFIPAYPEDIVSIAPKLWYYKVINDSIKILGTSSWGTQKSITEGERYIEGVLFAETKDDSRFRKMFYEKYKKEPEKLSTLGYYAIRLLKKALSEGVKDRAGLQKWLELHKKESIGPGVALSLLADTSEIKIYKIVNSKKEEQKWQRKK